MTAAAKALILSGLKVLEQALEGQTSVGDDRRVQILLTGELQPTQRFPISLRALGKDTLKQFIAEITSAVNRL